MDGSGTDTGDRVLIKRTQSSIVRTIKSKWLRCLEQRKWINQLRILLGKGARTKQNAARRVLFMSIHFPVVPPSVTAVGLCLRFLFFLAEPLFFSSVLKALL